MPEVSPIEYFLGFIILITVLVFVHEWGHFIVARMFNTKVDVFSIGFGREIFGWTDKKETRWKVCWLPLGGYVKFHGDATAASTPMDDLDDYDEEERKVSFHHKPLWQKALIIFAGPAINFVFAIFVFAALAISAGVPGTDPIVGGFTPDSAAEAAGIEIGDRILRVDRQNISEFSELPPILDANGSGELSFVLDRGGETVTIPVRPNQRDAINAEGKPVQVYRIGIFVASRDVGVFEGLQLGNQRTWNLVGLITQSISGIISGTESFDQLGGPLSIAQVSGQALASGLQSFALLLAFISISLGYINLVPIPLLDGGHLLFYAIEAIRGRPLSVREFEIAAYAGIFLILLLLFAVTWNDIGRLASG